MRAGAVARRWAWKGSGVQRSQEAGVLLAEVGAPRIAVGWAGAAENRFGGRGGRLLLMGMVQVLLMLGRPAHGAGLGCLAVGDRVASSGTSPGRFKGGGSGAGAEKQPSTRALPLAWSEQDPDGLLQATVASLQPGVRSGRGRPARAGAARYPGTGEARRSRGLCPEARSLCPQRPQGTGLSGYEPKCAQV